ncbi:hypothetical protein, partial [Streptococcus sp.]|uniref:hypothetical protein n=1 Tax=Streptococcus sp. TaxID=1306 RepID=UPI00391CB297
LPSLPPSSVIALRKDCLNTLFRIVASKYCDTDGGYLCGVMTVVRKLGRMDGFGQELNLDLFFDVINSLLAKGLGRGDKEPHENVSLLISTLSNLDK